MRLVSWGANQHGQLAHAGWSTSEQCETPQLCDTSGLPEDLLLAASERLTYICGGAGHTILLDTEGRLWVCGLNNKGQCGQNLSENIVRPWKQLNTPCARVVQVTAGWEHTLALTEDGVLLGWGSGSHGQLGPTVKKEEVACKAVEMARGVTDVAAGLRHSSWVTIDGKLQSCGDLECKNMSIPEFMRAEKVACGQRHTLALIKSEEEESGVGTVWGWGDNRHGQLGSDASLLRRTNELKPSQQLPSNVRFKTIKSGWSHAAGLTENGEVICWGRNSYGQLGVPLDNDRPNQPVHWSSHQKSDGSTDHAVQLALGSEHTMVLLESGSVLVCGWNEHGNCGTGDTTDLHSPHAILQNIKLIGCGAAHSFAVISDS